MPGLRSGHYRFCALFLFTGKCAAKNSFTIFVDRIFTVPIEGAFTNAFDRLRQKRCRSCLYPPRTTD
jgi:hypothetical protein